VHSVRIISPGMLTTVQDLGRTGLGAIGVPPSGAADSLSLRLGNRIVGNPDSEGGLEFTLTGPTLCFEAAATVAITGGEGVQAYIEQAGARLPAPANQALRVNVGDQLSIARPIGSARGYICISGGIAVEKALASRSTLVSAGLGGFDGRALRAGDMLPIGDAAGPTCDDDRASAAGAWVGSLLARRVLRVVPGLHFDAFSPEVVQRFLATEFTVADRSDRRGVRLRGPSLTWIGAGASGGLLPSEGMATGSVQVPHGGEPIILGVDRPTTGGYPVIACVIAADLPVVGALMPRTRLGFELVTREAARAAWLSQEAMFGECIPAVADDKGVR
jgi:biotin-dependent carboxylase-like uncharacterized protein